MIGVSFNGPLKKYKQAATDTEISLSGGFTRGALLTNV